MVGERWTLLIIRELLAGPHRFKDLLDGLPDVSTNLLTERLKSLEEHGLISRHTLPPPAASTVYELTPLGQGLETAVIELGKWGSQFLPQSLEGVSMPSLGTTALAIRSFFHSEQAQGISETFELHLGSDVLQIQIDDGKMHIQQGQSLKADVILRTEKQIFLGLFSGKIEPDVAIAAGMVQIEG